MKYLVVDDRKLSADALVEVLAAVDAEAQTSVALSASEALGSLQGLCPDVTFLDIEMPGTDGLELARAIQQTNPEANIVFVTGHPGYALEAHEVFASGFLVKPVTEEDVERALQNLRYPVHPSETKRLQVRCLGNFEVFWEGKPLAFERSKTKELFAYLIDRRGAQVGIGELVSALWEDGPSNSSKGAQLRNLIHDLRATLASVGCEDVILRQRGSVGVDCSRIDCDYYRLLSGSSAMEDAFMGEYMSQYSWAEVTAGLLSRELWGDGEH